MLPAQLQDGHLEAGSIWCGHVPGRCERSASASSPPCSYRDSQPCSVWRDTDHAAATSTTVRPSAMTANTALYRCSATLISLMRECQGSAEATVNHQPSCRWGRSGLNRRPTDYEASQSRRSDTILARFVLSWWSLVDPRNGPFSNWCATQVPQGNWTSKTSRWCLLPATGAGSAVWRPTGRGSPVAESGRVTMRVCALTSRARRAIVTGCDAGTTAQHTGSKRRPIAGVTAGACGTWARAGPCRQQRSRRY
jgi:hypothetical protein